MLLPGASIVLGGVVGNLLDIALALKRFNAHRLGRIIVSARTPRLPKSLEASSSLLFG